jgi:hypothetical protein
MFRRVLCENWHTTASIIAFALTAGVFFTAMLRALLSRKSTCDHLAGLPLDDEFKPAASVPGTEAAEGKPHD